MKHPYLRLLAVGILLSTAMQSCIPARIGAFFMPSVSDYKVFPLDTLAAAKHTSPAFVRANTNQLPDFREWVPKELRGKAENLDEFLKQTNTTSLLVMRNDTLLYEAYTCGHRKEDPQVIFSVTKGITAMLAAIAIQDGKMQLNQKVSDFIPEFAKDARRDIEIRHLLNMMSGINFDDKKNLARLSVLYYHTNQDKHARNYDRVSHKPGTHFAYNSISTQILSMCIEAATKQDIKHYLQEKLWEPLGLEYESYYTKDSKKHGNNRAFGGLAMRSTDMLRIGKLLLNKGVWEGKQILPASFVEEISTRKMSDDSYWGYSNFFWRDGYLTDHFLDDNDYFAAGFHGQYIYVNPKENIVMIRQGKKESFRWPLLFGRLVGVLANKGNDVVDVDKNYEEQFEGVYESPNGEKYEIVYKGLNANNGEKEWILRKDINQTLKTKKMLVVKRFDGRAIGIRGFSFVCRAIFDIQDNKVVGMYYDNQRAVDMRYFIKKGEMSLQQRKEVLANHK